jgi:uncharacterized protein YbcI
VEHPEDPRPTPKAATSGEGAGALLEHDHGRGSVTDEHGGIRAAVSNAMVGLKKEYYGKGPVKAKTYLNDDYVFCVMEGGLTRNEETLVEAGEEEVVRQYRLRFQEAVKATAVEAIERIMGRKVVSYHSQIVFHPDRAFEIFVLEPREEV